MSKAKDAYQQVLLWREEKAHLDILITDSMMRDVVPSIWLLQEAALNVVKKFIRKLDYKIPVDVLLPKSLKWVTFNFNDVYNHHDIVVLAQKKNLSLVKDETCEIERQFLDMSVWELCAIVRRAVREEHVRFMRSQCVTAFNEVHVLQKKLEELNQFTAQYAPVFADSLLFDKEQEMFV